LKLFLDIFLSVQNREQSHYNAALAFTKNGAQVFESIKTTCATSSQFSYLVENYTVDIQSTCLNDAFPVFYCIGWYLSHFIVFSPKTVIQLS